MAGSYMNRIIVASAILFVLFPHSRLFPEARSFNMPENTEISDYRLSPDGATVIMKLFNRRDNTYFVQFNETLFGPYESIDSVYTSPSGKIRYFIYKKNKQWFLNLDGRVYGGYKRILSPQFSPNEKQFAFRFNTDTDGYVNINGTVTGPFFLMIKNTVYFSTECQKYKYIYAYKTKDHKYYAYVSDGRTFGPFLSKRGSTEVIRPVINEQGTVFAFDVNRESLNINGVMEGPYYKVELPTFNPDGSVRMYYYYRSDNDCAIVFNNKRYERINEGTPVGECETRFAYRFKGKDGKWRLWVDGKVFGGYEQVDSVLFSRDCSRYNFTYSDDDGTGVNINGVDHPEYYMEYDREWKGIAFNDDGSVRLRMFKKNEKYYMDIMGKTFGGYDRQPAIILSRDGRSYAFMYDKNGRTRLNVNGRDKGEYDIKSSLDFAFSHNGTAYGFAYSKNGSAMVNINGKDFGPYESAIRPAFSDNGSIAGFNFTKDRTLYMWINGTEYAPRMYMKMKGNRCYVSYIRDRKVYLEEMR
jgi:hypothetical protein